MVESGGD